jgi:hypothetical protein
VPNTNEGKIQMAKLDQKLTDHIENQRFDMDFLKGGQARIETKLDEAMTKKADISRVDKLEDRGFAIIMAIIVAFIGLIVTAIKVFFGKL